jgi:hypothetical protein
VILNLNQWKHMQPLQLTTNHGHLRPLSAYIFSAVRFMGTTVHQNTSDTHWHGRAVRWISKAFVATGYLLNTPIALTESCAAFSLGLAGAGFHALTRGNFEFTQRYTLKLLSHSCNSFLVATAQLTMIFNKYFPEYHTATAFISQALYLGSAALTQFTWGLLFDRIGDRPNRILAPQRMREFLLESAPSALRNILHGLDRDFGLNQQLSTIAQRPNLQPFFQQHPVYQQTWNNFSIGNLGDATYRQSFIESVQALSNHLHLTRPVEGDQGAREVVLNTNINEDTNYQKELQKIVKDAFIEIYQTPELVSCLAEESEDEKATASQKGQEAMECFAPHIYIPLAHYAQLKELESQPVCPTNFSNRNLHQYNTRCQALTQAGSKLKALGADEKNLLIAKLLKGDGINILDKKHQLDSKAASHLQELYLEITKLAGCLHQGDLMAEKTLNIEDFSFSSNNLFQKACQEALKEISN